MKSLNLIVAALVCALVKPIFVNAQCGAAGTIDTTINTTTAIINSYYPGQGNPVAGQTYLTVGPRDTRGYSSVLKAGDLVVIMQMQGAAIHTGNSINYGSGTAGGSGSGMLHDSMYAGIYEYNTISSVSGSTIHFAYPLAANYYTREFGPSESIRRYQVIRVPRYRRITINANRTVTAPAWNGSTGGVVVLDASDRFTLDGNVDVSGKGFRGGGGKQFTGAGTGNTSSTSATVGLVNTDYRFYSAAGISANTCGGAKGESIAGTPRYTYSNGATSTETMLAEGYIDGSIGRGAPANGGGGGTDGIPAGADNNQYNTGGGGGANAGRGGRGGSGWHGGSGNVNTYPYGGLGGAAFNMGSTARVIMGGGGGAGTANNSTAANEYQASGGAGGGIIIIRATRYYGSGNGWLRANGAAAPGITGSPTSNTDSGGGGGAGGTIVAVTRQNGTVGLTNIRASANGGAGGNSANYYDHGPGGGGGGGLIIGSGPFAAATTNGGAAGLTRSNQQNGPLNNNFGAMAGAAGTTITLTGLQVLMNHNNSSSPCGALPVTLVSLQGVLQHEGVSLYWEITDAHNFKHFEIEYSGNGVDFTRVGTINYVEGRSKYSMYHNRRPASMNYYRLKMVDIDGTYTYSKIISLRAQHNKGEEMLAYPNPARRSVTVQVKAQETTEAGIRIYNSMGSPVLYKVTVLQKGENVIPLDVHNNPAGMYIIEIRIKKGSTLREKLQIVKE